jgi:hypothetical protein
MWPTTPSVVLPDKQTHQPGRGRRIVLDLGQATPHPLQKGGAAPVFGQGEVLRPMRSDPIAVGDRTHELGRQQDKVKAGARE